MLPLLPGIENVDYNKYPDETVQKKWIRMYLEEAAKIKGLVVACSTYIHVNHSEPHYSDINGYYITSSSKFQHYKNDVIGGRSRH